MVERSCDCVYSESIPRFRPDVAWSRSKNRFFPGKETASRRALALIVEKPGEGARLRTWGPLHIEGKLNDIDL